MKALLSLTLALSFSALAATPSSLFVKEGHSLKDVETLIADGEDIQSDYGYENFCYKGDVNVVMKKIKAWKKQGDFFSGGGGGHELKKVELIRGYATYDISLKFEDEVVPGEFETVHVKPCVR